MTDGVDYKPEMGEEESKSQDYGAITIATSEGTANATHDNSSDMARSNSEVIRRKGKGERTFARLNNKTFAAANISPVCKSTTYT